MNGCRLAVEHLSRYLDKAEDPYVLALAVNALVAYGEQTDALDAGLARLADQAEVGQGLALWPSRLQTLSGAVGGDLDVYGYLMPSARVESAALATLALSRARVYPERVDQGLATLTDGRDVYGTWNAPRATALALRAFSAALPGDALPQDVSFSSTVTVTVDEVSAEPTVFRGGDSLPGQVHLFHELSKGYNNVVIAVQGAEIAYQIVGSYDLPWSQVEPATPEEESVSVEVSYDRTEVVVGERIAVTVGVMLNRPGVAPLVVLELGLPPGLDLVAADLDGEIARYERVGERLVVYLSDLSSERPLQFGYHLLARYPLSVVTQPTTAVDVANPQRPAVRAPVAIEVTAEQRVEAEGDR
jgi:hypothetical protein